MSDFNGMGTIVLNTGNTELSLGRTDGEPYGFPRFSLKVTADIRVERLERQGEYETTNHRTVTEPLDFAITVAVWQPNLHDIVTSGREIPELTEYARGMDADRVQRLRDMIPWHLNGMTAGCDHQTVVWEDSEYGRRPSLENTPPCPVTGYRYGTKWLVRELPETFLDDLREVLADVIADRRVYVHPEVAS